MGKGWGERYDHARVLKWCEIEIFPVNTTFFFTNDFRFLIEYTFKSYILITVIYTHVWPMPSAKCLTPEKICFWRHIFHYKRLRISNRIPCQVKYTHCFYLYSCLTHTQCKALNTRLPGFRENRAKSRFFRFWLHIFSLRSTSDF